MAGVMTPNGIIVKQGDSFDIVLQVRQKCGCKPMDLNDCSVKMQCRTQDTNALVIDLTGDIVEPEKGRAIIHISPDQTKIDVGDYNTDIQLTLANGDVHTIFPNNISGVGIFRITQQVTE